MITAYETDKLKDPNSIVELEQVIQEQMENLYDVYQDHPDMNFRKTALYLLLLLRERKRSILEGMILVQGLIHSGYRRNNE